MKVRVSSSEPKRLTKREREKEKGEKKIERDRENGYHQADKMY